MQLTSACPARLSIPPSFIPSLHPHTRAYLEFLVSKYPDQLLLQELSDNSLSKPTLEALSYYGSRTLTDPSQEAIFNLLCDTMVQPPVSCATR